MRNLIDALHNFSTSKNSFIVFEDCNLNAILSDIVEYSRDVIVEKNATVKINSLPTIKGSTVLITQLFTNLLENALKYSKEDTLPKIIFSYEIIDSSEIDLPIKKTTQEFYVIKIEDNGIGFENHYRQQIFEAFQRLHSKDKFLGTGIGLAICKTIVKNHNGWIDAVSIPNIGSTFILYSQKSNCMSA